jgi:NAD+ kinase
MKRVALMGSPDKSDVRDTMDRVRELLADKVKVVFEDVTYDCTEAMAAHPDLYLSFGGDGTLISIVQCLDHAQVPVMGVNLGKLGYLAEFTLSQFERGCDFLFTNGLPYSPRVMLEVQLQRVSGEVQRSPAVNDCVILAGKPFRMIELRLEADGDEVAMLRGDGLVIATPSGSTAHNLSAGGPILEPTAEAFILTPICPHALTFRPVVVDARRQINVCLLDGNEGTTVSIDGQRNWLLKAGDRLRIQRHEADFLLVRNPEKSIWWSLRRKLMWAAGPVRDG